MPSDVCGRSSLQLILQASSRSAASVIDSNHEAFKHSALSRALAASMVALSVGLPALGKSISTAPRSEDQSFKTPAALAV